MTSLAALSGDWSAVSALLDDALALSPAERSAWLDALEGGAAAHRDVLRQLLATQAEVETDDFLVDLPSLGAASPLVDAQTVTGGQVGPYRLLSEIGRGGMGTVWLAERSDGAMKRQVALKLPRAVWGDAFAARLARERDILASLAHANIARLYDAGVDAQGRPYLAMEVVDGVPIDVHGREARLDTAARVALLLQVAGALAHAHTRLVVHRDLKPGNILVTPDGRVSVLDFGIAKLLQGERTAESALTQSAGRALTPDYASPEQIRGEPLGTASDIYSLGVVAYELLSGSRPYRLKRASAAELEEAIASAEPPLASTQATDAATARRLRGDLDSILNKALKKSAEARYQTMDAFADDLRRWANGQPVTAQPDRWSYRAAKFVQRHRLQVAAGGVAVLALAVGASVALWQAHEARQAADVARTEAATATAVQNFLQGVFLANSGDQADPRRAAETPARELLDRGVERIDADLANQPAARLRLYETLGDMYLGLGQRDKSLDLARRRLALARTLGGDKSEGTLQAMMALATALALFDERKEALDLLTRVGAVLDAAQDETSPLRQLLETSLANLYWRIDLPKALPAAQRALALARRGGPSRALVDALQLVGETESRLNHPREALAALQEAATMVEARPETGQASLPLLYGTIGDLQRSLGEHGLAEASYERGFQAARQSVSPQDQHMLAFKLANTQFGDGRWREAIDTLTPTVAWVRQQGEASGMGRLAASMRAAQGRAITAWGRPEEGLALFDEALATLQGNEEAPEHLGPILTMRADALVVLGRHDEADADLQRAAALIGDGQTGQAHFVRASRRRLWVATGRADAALADFDADPEAAGEASDPTSAWVQKAERAALAAEAGRPAEARRDAEGALGAITASPARPYLRNAEARANLALGRALLAQGEATAAVEPLRRAEALRREMTDAPLSLALAEALRWRAEAQQASGDTAAAAAARAEAAAIAARHPGRRG